MGTGEILISIIKVGSITLIGNKVCKAIGEKDIGNLVYGTGWLLLGTDIVLLLQPICAGITKVCTSLGTFVIHIQQLIQTVGKIFGN